MNFFFSFATFCLCFLLIATEVYRNVKFDLKRVGQMILILLMSLVFTAINELVKWLLLMLLTKWL